MSLFVANSTINWRQAPHGVAGSPVPSAQTAIVLKSLSPELIAFTNVVLSAHIERPNDAFSTLQPE